VADLPLKQWARMPKNRLFLISLSTLMVALGMIVFAPFVVSNGLRL